MSMIVPNSDIKLLANVPLDNTYEHTIYFSTSSDQYNYFSSKAVLSLTAQSYQRVNKGTLRVSGAAESFYNCNYLMFRNSGFSNSRWFYAFITKIEYINNNVMEITYELDVMQTWAFNYSLQHCFVEREHTATDNLFENTVAENLDLGSDYIINGSSFVNMNSMKIAALCVDSQAQAIQGSLYGNTYSPLIIKDDMLLTSSGMPYIDNQLSQIGERNIVALYEYPSFLTENIGGTIITGGFIENSISLNTTINGYTPRNKKLFSYPYNFIQINNNCGQTADYKWEYFAYPENSVTFHTTGTHVTSPAVICYPLLYRGLTNAVNDGIMYTNFPTCPIRADSFQTWWAQNKNSFVTSAITSSISAIGGGLATTAMASDPILGGAVGAVQATINIGNNIANSVAKMQDIENTPDQVHGNVQTDCLNAQMGRIGFSIYKLSIKAEIARIIDDYFDRYGYAVKRNKIPNRAVRKHWTYTKTIGCTITGSVPANDMNKICQIFDKGITFWLHGNEVGDYALASDNTVLS